MWGFKKSKGQFICLILHLDGDGPIFHLLAYYSIRSDEELALFSWKRPFELSSKPSLYVDGTSRRDVIQGILGDCWLLSTCAAIAKREELMHRVLSPKQVL